VGFGGLDGMYFCVFLIVVYSIIFYKVQLVVFDKSSSGNHLQKRFLRYFFIGLECNGVIFQQLFRDVRNKI